MTAPTSRDSDKFMLRLPDGMRDRIRTLAQESRRSMNAEIVYLLEFALDEIDIAAGSYTEPASTTNVEGFLRDRLRQSKRILEDILSDLEDPSSQPSQVRAEREASEKSE